MNDKLKLGLIVGGAIIAIIVIFVFAFQGVGNKAIDFEEQISTAKSDISVQQKRRADLIPNLVDCVKDYNRHEYETLIGIIKARNLNNDGDIGEITTMISALAEAYPELKSSENYKSLMNELSTTENLIANYRSNFNNWVKRYNQYIRKFPNRGILRMIGYEVLDYEYLTYAVSEDAPKGLFD